MAVTEPYSFRAVVETVKAKGGAGAGAGGQAEAPGDAADDGDLGRNSLPSG